MKRAEKAGWVVAAGAVLVMLGVLWRKRMLTASAQILGDVQLTGNASPARVVLGPALPPLPPEFPNWHCPAGYHVEWDNGTAVCVRD